MSTKPTGLEHNALTLRDVIFQGITHIAPAVNIVFTLPVIASKAGAAMPWSLALGVLVCLLIANTVAQFSRYVPSSGGYYTFVSRGLGPRWGFITTWSYLIYEIVGPAATVGMLGYFTSESLREPIGRVIPWWIFAVAATVIVWILTYRSVRLSAHTTAVLGAIEIVIFLALGVWLLVDPAPGSTSVAPLELSTAPGGWRGVLGGMVFSILALSGFEAPAPLAEESKRPTRFIYLAIFLSLLIVGIFYVFMAYSSAIGWGTTRMDRFKDENSYYDMVKRVWGSGWWVVFFALINCTLALGIASTNAATRVMYSMASSGTLPAVLKRIHPVHHTPYVAVHVFQLISIASFLFVGLYFEPGQIFEFLGNIASLAVILLYVLANVALSVFVWRRHRGDFSIWRHGLVPLLGTLFLCPVVYITIWPAESTYPYTLTPWVFAGLMILGVGVLVLLQAIRPAVLQEKPT